MVPHPVLARNTFLVKEHIFRQVVERAKNPEAYAAARNAKKENGLWQPVAPAPKKHFVMEAS